MSAIGQMRRMAFRQMAAAFPGVAASLYERAMLSPLRTAVSSRVNHRTGEPETRRLPYGDGWLMAQSWGAGPTVLLMHGWGGTSADMDAFVEPLVASGFRAVSFDAPAHGRSPGRMTNLVQCAGAALQVGRAFGNVHGIVAHSFGGPTAALAAQSGLAVNRFALLGPPASMIEMAAIRARRSGVPKHVIELTNRRVAARLHIRWDEIATDAMVGTLDAPVLVIHDRDDASVPWRHGERVAAAARHGRFVTTIGLGHDAILWDVGVIRSVVEFLMA